MRNLLASRRSGGRPAAGSSAPRSSQRRRPAPALSSLTLLLAVALAIFGGPAPGECACGCVSSSRCASAATVVARPPLYIRRHRLHFLPAARAPGCGTRMRAGMAQQPVLTPGMYECPSATNAGAKYMFGGVEPPPGNPNSSANKTNAYHFSSDAVVNSWGGRAALRANSSLACGANRTLIEYRTSTTNRLPMLQPTRMRVHAQGPPVLACCARCPTGLEWCACVSTCCIHHHMQG